MRIIINCDRHYVIFNKILLLFILKNKPTDQLVNLQNVRIEWSFFCAPVPLDFL